MGPPDNCTEMEPAPSPPLAGRRNGCWAGKSGWVATPFLTRYSFSSLGAFEMSWRQWNETQVPAWPLAGGQLQKGLDKKRFPSCIRDTRRLGRVHQQLSTSCIAFPDAEDPLKQRESPVLAGPPPAFQGREGLYLCSNKYKWDKWCPPEHTSICEIHQCLKDKKIWQVMSLQYDTALNQKKIKLTRSWLWNLKVIPDYRAAS